MACGPLLLWIERHGFLYFFVGASMSGSGKHNDSLCFADESIEKSRACAFYAVRDS
jgi:hypothetical protein